MLAIQQQIINAYQCQSQVKIVGNVSKVTPNELDELVNISGYSGVVEYYPEELVITVKAGTTLVELNQVLLANQQMLAFEPPDFGNSTIGGTVAMALSGQASAYNGGIRDFVLGLDIINGKGEYCRFGGKVMKNVAGFDVSRLLVGSAGTMAAIMQISFKVLPLAKLHTSYQISVADDEIISTINNINSEFTSEGLSAIFYQQDKLSYRLSSNHKLPKPTIDNEFWQQIQLPYFNDKLMPIMEDKNSQLTANTQIIDLGGNRRWVKPTSTIPADNKITLLKNKLKLAFDPKNIFV